MSTIAPNRLVLCMFCSAELDEQDRNTYRYGSAWFKNRPSKSGGTNTATLATYVNKYACRWCIEGKRKGFVDGQMSLWDEA